MDDISFKVEEIATFDDLGLAMFLNSIKDKQDKEEKKEDKNG